MDCEYSTEIGRISISINEDVIEDVRRGSAPDETLLKIYRDHLLDNIGFEIERMFENYFIENEREYKERKTA